MPKKRITIPKGTKDCQGVECQQNLEFEVDIPESTVTTATVPTVGVNTINPIPTAGAAGPQTVVLQTPPIPELQKEESKDPHEEMTKALPSGVNYAKCEGADCGHVKLKNPKQTTKYKACPHCKANMVPKNNDFCPNCGIEEESKKFEEWEDSDIEIEEEKEDE